jgi:aspartate/methionine/tyrosine aminotransferase
MNPFHFSSRTDWDLSPNELSRRVAEHRRRGRPLLDLTESNPTRCELSYPGGKILGALLQPENLTYEPGPQGLLQAREAVAGYYESTAAGRIDPKQILLTASTSEAYSFLFRLLAEPGDEILVPRPSYPLLDFLARLNDVSLKAYTLEYHRGWHVDLSSVEHGRSARTRALLVVNPNNPTGSGIRAPEQEALTAFCRDHQLALISDEVFLDFEFEDSSSSGFPQTELPDASSRPSEERIRLRSLAGGTGALTFCLNGISKMLGLPQMKLAWIVSSGPPAWLTPALERLEVIADTYLSVATPIQRALPTLLQDVREPMRRQILTRVRSNLRTLDERVAQTEGLCERLMAEGGWSAVLAIPRTLTEDAWVLQWLEQDGVLVHPGYFFDFEGEGHIVLSLIPPEHVFREGIDRIFSRIEKVLRGGS